MKAERHNRATRQRLTYAVLPCDDSAGADRRTDHATARAAFAAARNAADATGEKHAVYATDGAFTFLVHELERRA